MRRNRAILCAGLVAGLCQASAWAQLEKLAPADMEARNAAASFVQVRAASLQVVRLECGTMMPGAAANVDASLRAWYARNRDMLEAATVWLDQYLGYQKSLGSERHRAASEASTKALADGVLGTVRAFFRRQAPTPESCDRVVRGYATPQLDFQNIGANPGYASFGEFAKTLQAFRNSPDYAVPAHINVDYPERASFEALASLDAALAAKERGDGAAMRAIYTKLANYGNGVAAQTMGLAYLHGELTDKDYGQAYRWLYASWSLGNAEGLNAMGVMWRDGMGIPRDLRMAYRAFVLAQAMAAKQESYDRASRNLARIQSDVSAADRKELACMSVQAFDEAFRKAVVPDVPLRGRPLADAQRRVGAMVRALSDVDLSACP